MFTSSKLKKKVVKRFFFCHAAKWNAINHPGMLIAVSSIGVSASIHFKGEIGRNQYLSQNLR